MALDRRVFLKFIVGGAVGSALTPVPWKLTDDISIWTQNWPWIPDIPQGAHASQPSIVKLGTSNYGILVNTIDGNPVTASGNPEHQLSLGGIDPLAASCVQLLYSPSRISGPKLKKNGTFTPVSWSEASDILKQKLKRLKQKSGTACCISGDETSSANEVLSAFISRFNSSAYYFMPSDRTALNKVWQNLMSGQGSLGFDLENADLVLSLGADVLESWGTIIRNQKIFGRKKSEFIYAGPVQNNTAAVARRWIPVTPDALGHLALGIAYHLFEQGIVPHAGLSGLQEYKNFVTNNYSPPQAEQRTGLPKEVLQELAAKLLKARRPLVIAGSVSDQGASGFSLFAGLALNLLLDRVNKKGGLTTIPSPPQVLSKSRNIYQVQKNDLMQYFKDLAAGRQKYPEIMFVYESNPAYYLPDTDTVNKVLDKIPFLVSFSQFLDETAARADLLLPNSHFLERIDDSFTPFGSAHANYSLATPSIQPVFDTRSTPDFILNLAAEMKMDLGADSYNSLLKSKANLLGADMELLTKKGGAWENRTLARQTGLYLWNKQISGLVDSSPQDDNQYPLHLAAIKNFKIGSSQIAIPPLALKTIKEDQLQKNTFFVRLCAQTASKLKLSQGDLVEVSSSSGQIKAKVNIDEGVMPDAIAVPNGFGHTHWDEYSRNRGENVQKLFVTKNEQGSSMTVWSDTRVKIKKI